MLITRIENFLERSHVSSPHSNNGPIQQGKTGSSSNASGSQGPTPLRVVASFRTTSSNSSEHPNLVQSEELQDGNTAKSLAAFQNEAESTEQRTPQAISAQEDRELIERALFGDERSFEKLVQKYQSRSLWLARRIICDEEMSRDIAQEAFIRVYRNLHRYDPTKAFYTWFYRIVYHLAIDFQRKQKRTPRPMGDTDFGWVAGGEQPGQSLEKAELKTQVETILLRVPESYRVLLSLRDLEGFSSKEISDITGSNHATIRWRLHRARKLFRTAWEAEGLASEV